MSTCFRAKRFCAVRAVRGIAAVLLPLSTVYLGACSGTVPDEPDPVPKDSFLDRSEAAFPERLSEIGLYANLEERVALPVAFEYTPTWPLWSNGADKQRLLVVPRGEWIDSSDPDNFVFPPGTLFFKTFSFVQPGEPNGRAVETRVMRKSDAGWDFEAYLWNEEGTDGELLPLRRSEPVLVEPVEGESFEHRVPSRLECRQCHESAATIVLGFNRLSLSEHPVSGEPGALEDAQAANLFSDDVPRGHLPDVDALSQEVLGYLQGNCVGCHNGGSGPSSSFDLSPDVALDQLIERPTESSASAIGIRVVPGDPEASVLYQAISGQSDDPELKPMPPVGVQVRDQAAADLIQRWITSL